MEDTSENRSSAEAEVRGSSSDGPVDQSALQSEKTKELENELARAQKRVDELARALQASEKDREDFKLRTTRERERLIDVEKGKVAVSLVEAVDELELCLKGQENTPLVQGVRLIRDGLIKKLTALGCDRVQLVGLPYDANFAEASDMEMCVDEESDGLVTAEMRPCFRFNGRVIRPGLVRVSKFVASASA
jgi:molecular chaperone GrpE